MISKFGVLSSVSLIAMLGATPAFAQDAAQTGTAQGQSAAPNDTSAQPSDEIVVTGLRASLARAASIKRNSDNVVDSIVADDIGKFPDPTVASALQRVPGVQVTVGDNNEIVGPIIRGLGDILTTLDGREIFTGVGRGFAYQDLPAEALAGADVYKSSSAQLIEGGVAGQIDLRLHKPFDFKGLNVAASAQGIYTRNTEEVSPKLGLLVSDRFDTGIGEMGLLADVSYSRNQFDRPVAFNCDFRSGNQGPPGAAGIFAPTCVGGVEQEGVYTRKQANVAFQWQASPELQVYANGLYTAYESKWASIFLIDDVFGGAFSNVKASDDCDDYRVNGAGFFPTHTTNPDGSFNFTEPYQIQHLCRADSFTSTNHGGFTSTQAHHDRTNVYILSGGAKYDRGPIALNLDLSYQHSRIRNQNFILDTLKPAGGITTVVDNINDDGGTVYHDTVNGLSDRTGFGLSPLNQDNIRDQGSEFAAKFDGAYRVGGILKEIQFGARYADHSADHQQFLGGVDPAGVHGTLITNIPFLPPQFMTAASGIPSVNNGLGVIAPNQDLMRDPKIQDQLRALYGLQSGWPDFTPDRSFSATEKTYSGYLQAKYDIPLGGALSIDGLIGGRFTHTERNIAGAAYVTPAATPGNPNPAPVLTPFAADTTDDDFLPSASARVRFGGGLQARFTYARTIARPSFGDLNPGLSYLISTNILILPAGNGGNPDLKPQQADGYDATLEYYFGRNNFIAVAGYWKDIKNRVVAQSQVETIDGFDYNITRPRNLGSATLKGIEVSGQAFFDFLPGPLGGLGLFGNFTLADSKVNTVGDPLYGQRLQGVSKYNYNIGAMYEKYNVTARVAYTRRSSYYDENYGGTNIRPVGDEALILNTVRPSGRLDASVSLEFQPGVTLTLAGTNLTNANYRSYYGDSALPRDRRYDDATYSLGVSMRF